MSEEERTNEKNSNGRKTKSGRPQQQKKIVRLKMLGPFFFFSSRWRIYAAILFIWTLRPITAEKKTTAFARLQKYDFIRRFPL